MPTVSTGRGTGTRKVKKASAWAGSKYKKAQAKKNVGRTISTGRGTGTTKIKATKSKTKKRKPSTRSGRGYVSRWYYYFFLNSATSLSIFYKFIYSFYIL